MPFIAATTDPAQALNGLGASLFPSPLTGAQAGLLGAQTNLTNSQTQTADLSNQAAAAKAAAVAALPDAMNKAAATRSPADTMTMMQTATAAGVALPQVLGSLFASSRMGSNPIPQATADAANADLGGNYTITPSGQAAALAQSGINANIAAGPGLANAQTARMQLSPYQNPTTGETAYEPVGQAPPQGFVPTGDATSLSNAKTSAAAATAPLAQSKTYLQRNAAGGATAISLPGNVVPPTGAVPYDPNNPAASGQGVTAFGSQGGGQAANPLGNILFTDGNNPANSGQGGAQPAPGGPAPGVNRVPPTPSAPDPAQNASLPPAAAAATPTPGPTLAQTIAGLAAGNAPTPSVAGPAPAPAAPTPGAAAPPTAPTPGAPPPAAPTPGAPPTNGVTPNLASTVAPVTAPGAAPAPAPAAPVPDSPLLQAFQQQLMTGPGGGKTPPNEAGLAAADWAAKATTVDNEKNTGWFKGNPLQLSDQATTLLNAKAQQLLLTPQFRDNPAAARNEAWRLMSPGFTTQWHGSNLFSGKSAGPSLYGPPGSTLTPPTPDASAPPAAAPQPTPQPAAPQPTPATPAATPAAPPASPVQQTVMQQMASLPAASRVTGQTYQFGNLKVTWNGSGWTPN